METRNKEQINEHRSIEIISQMIAATKSDIDRESGKYFLLWGYTTVLVSLFEFFAQTGGMDSVACAWCWWLIPLVGGVGTLWLSHILFNVTRYVPFTETPHFSSAHF